MSSTPPSPPAHVGDLLRLLGVEPGRPRLTWYGDDGERVELSGAVLENWVNKTTNLLVEEFDAGPGTRVLIDLPVHWRTVVWALAAWRVGATVVLAAEPGQAGRDDVVVTARPVPWAGGPQLVAVALPALARRFDDELPAGAIDAAGAVMTYGDQVGWVPEVDLGAVALERDGTAGLAHGDLLAAAVGGSVGPGEHGARRLVRAGDGAGTLLAVLATLADGGSVVLLSAGRARELDADPDALARLVAAERVTA